MRLLQQIILLGALVCTSGVRAESETFPPQNAPTTFVGVLDFESRYGGGLEWARAAWGMEDPLLEFEIADGRPFEATKIRLKARQFAMLETGYEHPSILVYQRIDDPRESDWLQVIVDGARTWIRVRPEDHYTPYTELFDKGRLAYLLRKTIDIAEAPDGPTTRRVLEPEELGIDFEGPWEASVQVVGRAEIVTLAGQQPSRDHWLKIRVETRPPCEGEQIPAEPLTEGWIRARHQDDQSIAVWFHSRGC